MPTPHWSYNYIDALADYGISLGYNGKFSLDEPVTRLLQLTIK
ncbi:S-layer homology domain-containing protein [Lysinibacillus sp. NPDC094403]